MIQHGETAVRCSRDVEPIAPAVLVGVMVAMFVLGYLGGRLDG